MVQHKIILSVNWAAGQFLNPALAPVSHDRILEHGTRGVDRGHSSRSMRSISSRLGGAKSAAKSSAMGR